MEFKQPRIEHPAIDALAIRRDAIDHVEQDALSGSPLVIIESCPWSGRNTTEHRMAGATW